MKKSLMLSVAAVAGIAVLCWIAAAQAARKDAKAMESEARAVIDEYMAKYKPLDLGLRKAWYRYDTTGDKKASAEQAELELEIRKLSSDAERFARLKDLYKARQRIIDPLVRRQVEVLYLGHLPNQVPADKLEKLTELEKRLEEGFNDYRAELNGKKLTPVDVAHILAESTDSATLEKVWKSQSKVGGVLEKDYRDVVKLRNEIARVLGYKNALELEAEVNEMSLEMLDKFYKDVANATDEQFRKLKQEYIDPRLAERYGIKVGELQPWHYQNEFFQEAPTAIFGKVDLDSLYKGVDSKTVVDKTIDFYASMGVDIQGIINNSSLYPAPGKNPHAVAWLLDPDRPGSSVLIMNLPKPPKPPKSSEASTLVHELAHDINYEAILANKQIPYLLREPTMLTEAFAMLMEGQTETADWFTHLGVPVEKAKEAEGATDLINYVDQLIFLRWSAAIYCFERAFYGNPDADIGDTWWECREKNQFLARPANWKEPDALAKYHIPVVPPLYYSNYAIGRIANSSFAALFDERVGAAGAKSFYGRRELGDWLMKDFLAQGELYRWDEFIKQQTGKPFSMDAWKKRYIGSDAEKRLYAPTP
ncbi:MAG: M2 family metallopeptidase [bacterium]